jgi:hypothetical protein
MNVPSHCVFEAAAVVRWTGVSGGFPLDTTLIAVRLVISTVVKKTSIVPVIQTMLPMSCKRGSLAVLPKTLMPRPEESWM